MADGKNGNEVKEEQVDVVSISRNRTTGELRVDRTSTDLVLSLGLLEIARVLLTVPFERGLTGGGPRVLPVTAMPRRPV